MLQILRRTVCLAAALALLAGTAGAAGYYPEKEHAPVDFAGMACEGFDETALTAALDRLEALCGPDCRKSSQPEAQALYEVILQETDLLSTQFALANIFYDGNGAEAEAADALAELTEQSDRLRDRCYEVLGLLADSPCRGVLDEAVGEEVTSALQGYEAMSGEESSLRQEETRLVQAYDQTMASGVEAEVDGQIWTLESLEAAEISNTAYWRISRRLEEARNQAAGEIFRQLVQVRNAIAGEAGYDSYAGYAYEAIYGRDYSPRDARRLWQSVKRAIVPLEEVLLSRYSFQGLDSAFQDPEPEEILNAIQPVVEAIHPELAESFAFLRQYHLCDIEARPEKLPTGYTISLPSYGSAYIFNSPYGTYQDYSDMIHEFGHFNQAFHDPTPDLWAASNIDTAEIHSQALELFFASASEPVFGQYSGEYMAAILYNLLCAVMDGCMYDEFQAEVYQHPDLSLEEINRRFKDISEDYGYVYPDGQEESWFWLEISHTFQSPFYYISYAVSALSALDLWLRSLSGWDAAVNVYMELTALPQDIPFRAALEEVELADIFDNFVVRDIARTLRCVILEEEVDYPGSFLNVGTVGVTVVLFGGAAVIYIAATRAIRARSRSRARAARVEENWKF